MSSIFETYSSFYERLKDINNQYVNAESQLSASKEADSTARLMRIDNLEVQLKKIDEYMHKVEYFRNLAERHLTSKNILTITPRELNFKRMRYWAPMIDPMNPDDPYAQRIYVQAKCNEMFLNNKKVEFEKTLEELKEFDESQDTKLAEEISKKKIILLEKCREIIESPEFEQFAEKLHLAHAVYVDTEKLQEIKKEFSTETSKIAMGGYAQPLPIFEELKTVVKHKIGDYYDSASSSIMLPVEITAEKEHVISVVCNAGKEKKVYRGIQNYLLNYLSSAPIGANKIYLLDGLHYNTSVLGNLKQLENTEAIQPVPKNSETIVDTLKQIVSSLADIDETIGMYDSVEEYNNAVKPEERIERKMLVLVGYPAAFTAEAKEYIKRILYNFEHYAISMILIDPQFVQRTEEKEEKILPVELVRGIVDVKMMSQKETVCKNNGSVHSFRWYELKEELKENFVNSIKEMSSKTGTLGSEYIKRIDMENYPDYERGKKEIDLPYGVDQEDQVHSISFGNENFASYLMGASGSGKSTLLHTLITGIIRDYHPDDVELWLADFKMSEFAQYIEPMPPHIKYILLDESQELVYDLLDKLTEKMMERQRFFMTGKNRELKKVENVSKETYMPVIFVILDEFSIMSQAVAESEYYKLRLQNLLAKGRALGIKFIFASQTFTKGIGGLTATAKDQIQSRIAMKNSYNEINETLELSSDLRTDQVRNWMNALPPYYTLFKYRDGDELRVKRLNVMYFKGKGDEALKPQRDLIKYRCKMKKVEDYDFNNNDCYVDKHPVVVDGNSFKAFDEKAMKDILRKYKAALSMDDQLDETHLVFGTPRRMSEYEFTTISRESRENILLVARSAEQSCGMAVILTAMQMFKMQGGKVHVWAYHKNRLYRAYKDSWFNKFEVAEGIEEICTAISEIKEKIMQKEQGNDLFVMIGMEQICGDFELLDSNESFKTKKSGPSMFDINTKKFEVNTEEEKKAIEFVKMTEAELDERIDEIWEKGEAEGKDFAEIQAEIEEFTRNYLLGKRPEESKTEEITMPSEEPLKEEEIIEEEPEEISKSYDATNDFRYIVRQGSRFGYHFFLCLNNLSDLKSTKLQEDLFKHRMAFQVSGDDSIQLFSSKVASKIPEHICQYSNMLEQYSFRPFLHKEISWDGWQLDEDGHPIDVGVLLNK